MNAMERFWATMEGRRPDCYAVTPYNGNFSIRLAGMQVGECYTDGKRLAQAQIRAWEQIGQDVVVAQSEQYYIAEGLGLKTRLHADALPEVVEPRITNLNQVSSLRPIDPYRDGRCYVYIEAVGLLAQHFKGQVPVRAPGTGAFTLGGHLMGLDNYIMAMAEAEADEDQDARLRILEMLEVTYESHYRYCEACVKAGATIVQSGDSLASLDAISPTLYKTYAQPFEKRFFKRISRLKTDYRFASLLHICGDNTRITDLLMDTGCDILEVDYKVNLPRYLEAAANKTCLMGNLNPAGALLSGTPAAVAREVEALVGSIGHMGRFFIGSGCEVAANAPAENLRTMVTAGHEITPAN